MDEIPEAGPYRLELKVDAHPGPALWEPGHRELPVRDNAGAAIVEVPRFRIHWCVVVEGVLEVTRGLIV